MGQVHHGSATTTAAVRRAIQHSQESLRVLAKRYGINPKTVAKWKGRTDTSDRRTGPKVASSTILSTEEEAIVVAFRRHTLLPLDDCLYALQATIPHLTRSSLHRCFQRHGISRLPETEGDKPKRSKFKSYPIGYFHIDIAEVRTEMGRLYLLVAIDRTSKFAFVQLHEKATRRVAGDFLRALAAAVPYRIHTVLTDNGTHFTDPAGNGWTPEDIKAMRADGVLFRCHSFELACADLDIEHRLTKPRHPWTNGQVERMNRTIKDATVKRFYYETHDQLRQHLADFVTAYNFARRLKTLRGLTPYEFICQQWEKEPSRFIHNPHHQIPGPNIYIMLDEAEAEYGGFPQGTNGAAPSDPRYAAATGDQVTVANAIVTEQTVTALVIVCAPVAQPTPFTVTDLGTANTAANQAAITEALQDMFTRLSSPAGTWQAPGAAVLNGTIHPNMWEEAIGALGLPTFTVASPSGPVVGATNGAMPTLGPISFAS